MYIMKVHGCMNKRLTLFFFPHVIEKPRDCNCLQSPYKSIEYTGWSFTHTCMSYCESLLMRERAYLSYDLMSSIIQKPYDNSTLDM